MKKSRLLGAVCTCLLVIASTPIFGSVIYSYTGRPFDSFSAPTSYTNEMEITATIELATPLGADLFYAPVSPLSYSINDGINTITQDTATDKVIQFTTDANGNITDWIVTISIDPGLIGIGDTWRLLRTVAVSDFGDYLDDGRTVTCTGTPCTGVRGSNFEDMGGNINQPGNWTFVPAPAEVPVPGALWLFGSGLLGLVGIARRKKA